MSEECTAIAVCVFVGTSSVSWSVRARSFAADEERSAAAYAETERREGHKIVLTRRFTKVTGTSRRSEWRIGDEVIVESEDFGL